MVSGADDSRGRRIIGASVGVSALLFVLLGAAHVAFGSELALAQAADSLADVLTASALIWAIRLSQRPPDRDHPFGHQSAQPIAALVISVLTGVLAAEVLREAIGAILAGSAPTVTTSLLAVLSAKAALKAVFAGLALSASRRRAPALYAFFIDARNDVILGVTSVVGLGLSTWLGIPTLDAWLAIPVAGWIAWSGVSLGRENASLLMGAMPTADRIDTIRSLARSTPGVRRVASVQARHHGNEIHVWLEIRVDPELTVREGHDIGEAVERRLLAEEDIYRADVHIDAATNEPAVKP